MWLFLFLAITQPVVLNYAFLTGLVISNLRVMQEIYWKTHFSDLSFSLRWDYKFLSLVVLLAIWVYLHNFNNPQKCWWHSSQVYSCPMVLYFYFYFYISSVISAKFGESRKVIYMFNYPLWTRPIILRLTRLTTNWCTFPAALKHESGSTSSTLNQIIRFLYSFLLFYFPQTSWIWLQS